METSFFSNVVPLARRAARAAASIARHVMIAAVENAKLAVVRAVNWAFDRCGRFITELAQPPAHKFTYRYPSYVASSHPAAARHDDVMVPHRPGLHLMRPVQPTPADWRKDKNQN